MMMVMVMTIEFVRPSQYSSEKAQTTTGQSVPDLILYCAALSQLRTGLKGLESGGTLEDNDGRETKKRG